MGDAIRLALEMPSKLAIGLAHAAVQTPLLQTVKNMGMIELILPDSVVPIAFILLIVFCVLAAA
jgi:hypothetical protein